MASAAPVFKHEGEGVEDPTTAVFFGCGYCSQVFFDRAALEVHINLQHEGCAYSCVPAPMPKSQAELLHQPHTTVLAQGIPMSEVNRHNTKDDCWVAINGKVYDLSEFLERHPGGPGSVLAFAGKDSSEVFNSIHQASWIEQYLRPEDCLGNLGVADGVSETYWHSLRLARIREVQEELKALTAPEAAAATGVTEAAIYAESGKEPPSRFFGCGHCGEAFAELKDLEVHETRFHEGQPFSCVRVPMPKQFAEVFDDVKRIHSKGWTNSDIPLSEVSRHNKPKDCWVAVNGQVWDLTQVLLQYPECRNAILAWAGRDASKMWDRVPGRFPSAAWNNHYLRPEALMGKVGPEPELDAREIRMKELRQELRRLEGPTENARAAAAAAAAMSPRPSPRAKEAVATKQAGQAGQAGQAAAGPIANTFWAEYARMKLWDAGLLVVGYYLYLTLTNRKPLSQFTYSRALRHMHLLMGVGLIGTVGSVQLAARTEGAMKKQLLKFHRQSGIVMLFALILRVFFRLRSGIPPRFPGLKAMQFVETQSLRAFYVLALLLPVTGMASDYFLHWSTDSDEARSQRNAKQAIEAHKVLGKVFQYAWLPFHFGYTTLYHYSQGRGVVRKVSPFI